MGLYNFYMFIILGQAVLPVKVRILLDYHQSQIVTGTQHCDLWESNP